MSRVDQIKSIVDAHISDLHSLSDIAKHVNCSPETIRKEFIRVEHIPLSDYITKMRVEKAKQLLSQTNLTCCEICFAVGFSRPEVAMRAFKRLSDQTMNNYRQMSRTG